MARPTYWRRSWNVVSSFASQDYLNITQVPDGDTLGGTWWYYQLHSLGATVISGISPMPGAAVLIGLIMQPESATPADPMDDPLADWLWWELVAFDHAVYNTIDTAYLNWSTSGTRQRKAEGMRVNDSGEPAWLRVAWNTYAGSSTSDEINFDCRVGASALIIEGP